MQAFVLAPSLTLRVGMDPFFLQIEKTHCPSSPPLVLKTVLSRRYVSSQAIHRPRLISDDRSYRYFLFVRAFVFNFLRCGTKTR